MTYREKIAIVSEGSGTSRTSYTGRGGGGGRGGQAKLWGGRGGGGGRFGRASSAGDMSHILFRGSAGGVEGRLPREVRSFPAERDRNNDTVTGWARGPRMIVLGFASRRAKGWGRGR